MVPVSVVIITKNAADIIKGCIEEASKLTDDIIVVYNGSETETSVNGLNENCRFYNKAWEGYGANKNKGVELARYNWILSIDADEVPDDELISAIHKLNFDDKKAVYDIKFRSYFGGKPVRFGSWGKDHHIRLFNREFVKWSETIVHETLTLPSFIQKKKIEGHIHHYSVKNVQEFDSKGCYYANLSAKKYFRTGKKAGAIKLYISPIFGFIKNYIVYLGFLDGRTGWNIAKITVKHTRRKYHFLSQMEITGEKKQPANESLVVEY
ncbi:glycosyltransferase family 2 protein [Mucilaginibacter sp. BJC16-A38]|uniref:glycosyltransferase family 2 protein n=1 Tax=Mucilaginibacter phenanthrenivorans TaxID=1234842 RepID=UPI002157B06F|nr:glycosyltransferase family 2 protein [Mucilaginibacter phenanthrenivorans]MCR8559992.1 glycosyltransferase family 2 protein [Mucilaginibacter phenanthrenivorans]